MMDGRASYIDDAALLLQPSRAEGWTTAQAPKSAILVRSCCEKRLDQGPNLPVFPPEPDGRREISTCRAIHYKTKVDTVLYEL